MGRKKPKKVLLQSELELVSGKKKVKSKKGLNVATVKLEAGRGSREEEGGRRHSC